MTPVTRIAIDDQIASERARQACRAVALSLGFSHVATEEVLLALSELATNLLRYAEKGEIFLTPLTCGEKVGIEIMSLDQGPGIADPERAMVDGYSTGGGMGNGLPAVRRLTDEFSLATSPEGTRIVIRKWRRDR